MRDEPTSGSQAGVHGRPVWVALPHPAWVEYQKRTGKVITDPLAVEIAGHYLKTALESGEGLGHEMYSLTVAETLRHIDAVRPATTEGPGAASLREQPHTADADDNARATKSPARMSDAPAASTPPQHEAIAGKAGSNSVADFGVRGPSEILPPPNMTWSMPSWPLKSGWCSLSAVRARAASGHCSFGVARNHVNLAT